MNSRGGRLLPQSQADLRGKSMCRHSFSLVLIFTRNATRLVRSSPPYRPLVFVTFQQMCFVNSKGDSRSLQEVTGDHSRGEDQDQGAVPTLCHPLVPTRPVSRLVVKAAIREKAPWEARQIMVMAQITAGQCLDSSRAAPSHLIRALWLRMKMRCMELTPDTIDPVMLSVLRAL
jgi:hypothetical protein